MRQIELMRELFHVRMTAPVEPQNIFLDIFVRMKGYVCLRVHVSIPSFALIKLSFPKI
jgi:hypothetical protein